MSNPENALPPAGQAKPTQNSSKCYEIGRRDRLLLVGVLLVCFLAVDTILWTWPHGIGLTAAVFAWYVLLFAALGPAGLQKRENRVLLLANLALAVTYGLSSSAPFHVWNFLALLVLLPIHACGLSGGAGLPWWQPMMLWERMGLLLRGLFGALGAPFAVLTRRKNDGDARRFPAVVLGTVCALALLGILVPVLSSADALFAAATADLRRFVAAHLAESLWKLALAMGMTPFLFSLLYRLRRPVPGKAPSVPAPAADSLPFLIVLTALDVLYLLFLAVQSAGLFGGADYLAARGISYAEWARSGFFQMVGVTAVNLTVILAALTFIRRSGRGWIWTRLLSAVLTGESLVLLASAAWRMTLYVTAYGLSFKRCLTYWGMGMMALFFLTALAKIHRPDRSFCRTAFPLALAGWLLLNCVPVDYLVARDQVDRYLSGAVGSIDVEYLLYDLSYDALSPLERLDGSMICKEWTGYQKRLNVLIAARRAEAQAASGDWRSWSFSACLAAGESPHCMNISNCVGNQKSPAENIEF